MKLIVGLGNPGKEYELTRHNIGFMVIDEFLKRLGNPTMKKKFKGLYYEYNDNGEKIIFLKPQSYINLSGEVIDKYISYYGIEISDIIIINDDLDLELGKYKLKPAGGSAGHNGLKNIEYFLQTDEYKRLKIGISNNKLIDTKDYVLGRFNEDEQKIIRDVIKTGADIIEDYPNLKFEDLMNKYNKNNG